MPNERENLYQTLTRADFNIAGLTFRAYFDADDKLVFVLDTTINDVKPNAMLIINPIGSRKWDDILANDYGVDLETVRPKKDNKYQKLDIEYTGLAEYDALIAANKMAAIDDEVLNKIGRFLLGANRRAAYERLADAEITAEKSRETIEKTTETIAELQEKLKKLRVKLADYRRNVGKEPTKQSAAKILKVESQIDTVTDKLGRANKRLDNAKVRLSAAEDDKEQAIYVLRLLDERGAGDAGADENADLPIVAPKYDVMPAQTVHGDVAVVEPAPVPMNVKNDEISTETKAIEMADDEVKPLFDKNPNILDDEIAFKPIDFDVPVAPVANNQVAEQSQTVEPLRFVSPVTDDFAVAEMAEPNDGADDYIQPVNDSVLDNLRSVEQPSEQIDSELLSTLSQQPDVPVLSEQSYESPAPIVPSLSSEPVVEPGPQVASMPEIAPAPISSEFRPVSPITGVAPVEDVNGIRKKPTMLYYVMLILLIVLSVFTLWVYQQKMTNDSMPELAEKNPAVTEVAEVVEVATVEDKKDAVPEEVELDDEPEQPVAVESVAVVVEDVVPETVVATPAEPVQPVADVKPLPVEVTPEPTPVLVDVVEVAEEVVPEPVKKIPSEAEILAAKPAYNVSQNEKMFVADAEFESDTDDEIVSEEAVSAKLPVVEFAEPVVENVSEPEIYAEDFVSEEVVENCADGNAPDADGCCAGEYLTDVGGGEYACCAEETGECFPPMF
ncbi:MAG: hypothetical protein E7011_01560 [Alphaproteobacteria bacterium]|nr:hypothetical protein [Alphaproteobacteria bacterium]